MKSSMVAGALFASVAYAQNAAYAQCGGQGFTGDTTCVDGFACTASNSYYSQCLPGIASSPDPVATDAPLPTGASMTTVVGSPSATPVGKVEFAGVNIAGFDFGCGTDGSCKTTQIDPPLQSYGNDGIGQMQHFVTDDNMNVFRLPVAWQYLTPTLGGSLDQGHLSVYDQLVQGCLSTGAHCIIDIHNYARWNGAIIGQGGPTNDQFASLWKQIASKYASQSRIIFGIMNEPHDGKSYALSISPMTSLTPGAVPNIVEWAASVQAAVTAIRSAGATSQIILLPGNNYTSAGAFISNGSAAALSAVKNPDGSITNLIFDVHKYLDSDNSGTHTECVTNNIDGAFAPLAAYLRTAGRQAFLTETGGGNTASCELYLCQEIAYLNANSDVYLGYVGWAAGSFGPTYELTETPTRNGNTWQDTPLVKDCLAR